MTPEGFLFVFLAFIIFICIAVVVVVAGTISSTVAAIADEEDEEEQAYSVRFLLTNRHYTSIILCSDKQIKVMRKRST